MRDQVKVSYLSLVMHNRTFFKKFKMLSVKIRTFDSI